MVEVVRGIRHRSPGYKIFGKPIRPLPERIGPAVARNGSRRETPPGGSRRETLIVRDLVQKPLSSGAGTDAWKKAKQRCTARRGLGHHIFISKEEGYRGSRRSMRFACSTPLSSTWPSTITNELSFTSSCCPGFPNFVHSVELSSA